VRADRVFAVIPIDGPERGNGQGRMCTSRGWRAGRRVSLERAMLPDSIEPREETPNSRAGGGFAAAHIARP